MSIIKRIALILLCLILTLSAYAQSTDLSQMQTAQVVSVTTLASGAINLDVIVTHADGRQKEWDHYLSPDELALWNGGNQADVINKAYAMAFQRLPPPPSAPPVVTLGGKVTAPVASDTKQWLSALQEQVGSLQAQIAGMADTVNIDYGPGGCVDDAKVAIRRVPDCKTFKTVANPDKAAAQQQLSALQKKLP